ncbi:Spo0B domain-containing protein [Paenibacillus sp. N3.4]|uniref:Spo0B domain-containing protein n=1 Tax=Paenibacillus sp. N3.4 TaxID=2603222 RepID=UPI0011C91C69|nr:Spo0B domain-containing protein [Paenibacillus sp. N3.4]TXK84734.1 hypothetical protein FU659_07890 [Paenibacillus sp. N3.4]
MKRVSGAQVYLLALVLIGLTGLMFVEPWLARAALLLLTVFCGYLAFKLEISRIQEKWCEKLRHQEQQSHINLLRVINRLRHDWMNDTQILFGYIQMKKFDNLPPYMEKIKMNMQQESNLSKLGIPSLIAFLLMVRVQSKSLQLDLALDQEVNLAQLPIKEGLIEKLIIQTVGLFEEFAAVEDGECGTLSLELDVQEDYLLLDFVYQGAYNRIQLEQAVGERLAKADSYSLENNDWQEEEAVIALRLPFRT